MHYAYTGPMHRYRVLHIMYIFCKVEVKYMDMTRKIDIESCVKEYKSTAVLII